MSNTGTFALPGKKRRALLERATQEYGDCLELALPYLTQRGIPEQVAKEWQLGYVLDPLPGHEDMKGRLVIPYLTLSGTIDLKFRCIKCTSCEGHPKYMSEAGSQARLFGVLALQEDSPYICVCEGELDALCAYGIAGLPALGISGATKWRRHWQYVLEGYQEVIVLRDGDNAGKKFADHLCNTVYNSRQVSMGEGLDVNSFLTAHGPAALREKAGVA
jgi:DNA primase